MLYIAAKILQECLFIVSRFLSERGLGKKDTEGLKLFIETCWHCSQNWKGIEHNRM